LLPGYPDVRVLVALSGGVDSTALLGALAASRLKPLRLRAAHVDHGIHPSSSGWSGHCSSFARALGIPLVVLSTKVSRAGGVSLEAAARDARYALLAQALEPGEYLLTAHHEDDQLETVLLQLFRGAGIAGLSAMPEISRFAAGWLVRPLLTIPRQELKGWVQDAGLTWVEDDTNADESLDRNYLRRQIVPLIRARWKGVASAVARSARHAAEGQRLLDMIALADVERASNGPDLSVPALRALQPDRRRNALRFWIIRSGARVPDSRRLEELAGPAIDARPDANPRVEWGTAVVRRHAELLSISTAGARGGDKSGGASLQLAWTWRVSPTLELPDAGGTLQLKPDLHGPIDLDSLPETVTVRYRRGGERLRPRRGGARRALKSLLQESHLSMVERARLPLLFSGATLLAAGTLWVDESIQTSPGSLHRGRLIHNL
jgi:tRNA(Ile)-lysidine synthase